MGTTLVSATEDVNDNAVLNNANIVENDNTNSVILDDNSQIEKSETNVNEEKTNTSTLKQLTKTDKNLKGDMAGKLSMNATSGYPGDIVELSLYHTAQITTSRQFIYNISLDGVVYVNETLKPTVSRYAYYNFTIPDVAEGEYALKFNLYYNKAINIVGTDTFTVLSSGAKLQVENDSVVQGQFDNFVLPVNIRDSDSNPVNVTTSMTIMDGDVVLVENYSITSSENNILVPVKRAGEYSLTVILDKTEDYAKSTCQIPINVTPVDTVLIVDDNDDEIYSIINVLSNTVITGTLTTTNGNPVKNAELTLIVKGQTVKITTDDNGFYSYSYPVTEIDSDIPISISFEGTDSYNPSESISGFFDIEPIELVVTFDEIEISEVNETTTISGTVKDTFGLLLNNASFNLTISGIDEPITVTSTDGIFSYDHVFTQAGTNTVTASCDLSSGLYEMDEESIEFATVVGPRKTVLTVDVGQGEGNFINITDVDAYTLATITTGQLVDIFDQAVTDVDITVIIEDNIIFAKTDSEGKFTVIYNATQGLKDYPITIRFDGNEEYKNANEIYTGTFTTNPLEIKVTLNDNLNKEYLLDEDVVITGYATLVGAPYSNEEIKISIDDNDYTILTDENGSFSYTYTTDTLGRISIKSTESDLTINVIKPEVSVTLDDIEDSKVFVPIDITGKLILNSNQTGMANTIVLTINNESFNIQTNDDGQFTYTYTPTALGTYNVKASFDSIQYTTTSNDTKIFNVEILKTTLIGDELPIAVKFGEVFTISGNLQDEIKRPVADAEITIIINDEIFTTITDDEGIYSLDYHTKQVSDNNLYEVRYYGDENHDMARNYVGSFFDVEKTKVEITVDAQNSTKNTPTTITGQITSNNSPLSGVAIKVIVNDEEFETTSNDEGVYEIVYTPNKLGAYKVSVIIYDTNYNAEANTTFNVDKADTITTVNPIILSGYETNITATVVDINNNPVGSGKAVFKINGKTVKDENGKVIYLKVENGIVSMPYTFTQDEIDKKVLISASYSGSVDYMSSSSDKINITLVDQGLKMTLNDMDAYKGQTVTLTVTIKNNNQNVDGGKVVFKLNGKTIKDENGKVIYADVVDGQASCEYLIANTTKANDYTLSAVFISTIFDRIQTNATIKVSDALETNTYNPNKTHLMGEDQPKTIIITNDTITDYITDTGFTDLVNDGDTLDFIGTISNVNGLTTIIINKPVNIITSTNDGRIELFNNITFTNAASGSNITGLCTFNTQFYVVNADNMVFDNISNIVDNKAIGSQVGQTSIREICTNITIKNSLIKTINNGGSSSLVFTYVSYSNVINNTIIGEGKVGNLFYFNSYNAGSTSTVGNSYNVIANNTIIGPEEADICYAIAMLLAHDNIIENNTVNYTGITFTGGSSNSIIRNNIIYGGRSIATGIFTNNTFYDNASLSVNKNSVAENNTIYGTLIVGNNSIVGSNVADNLIICNNATVNNVTINGNASFLSNGTVASNSILENSTIMGDVIVSSFSRNIASNNKIQNNQIGGNITISRSNNLTIANNNINGTIEITTDKAGNTLITRNNITTVNEYTIINNNQTTTISDNQLVTPNAAGQTTINDLSSGATITGNGPAYTINITMENYANYFDENGIFINNINDEIIIVLHGQFDNVMMNFKKENLKLVGYDENTILNDCIIILSNDAHITVENITFVITEDNIFNHTAIKVQSDNNTIINNTITVISNNIASAILVENANEIIIMNNSISVDGGYAISLINSLNTQITNNYLNTTMGKNNYAVLTDDDSDNILIQDNTPDRNEVEISFNPIMAVVLDDLDVTINFIDNTDSSQINDGFAYIMINDEIITDNEGNNLIFNVENGQIHLDDYPIPTGWLRSDAQMTIVYTGTGFYQNITLNTQMNIAKRDAHVEILTKDITANIGETITLHARITDNGELVSSGKVAFKLNGNSLEDENSNLICVNVVDGIATLEYTITSQIKSNDYILTAVFENMIYNRSTDDTTFKIIG